MRAKYLVIGVLFVLLGMIVYQMMRFEKNIRAQRIVKIKVRDETKPLINELPTDKLKELAEKADYYFMAKGDYFQVIKTGSSSKKTEPIFLKGVNLGVAMPGHFPTEFSLSFNQYLAWFQLIGKMNANVIRIYTILPPEFYDAFAYYNLHYNEKKIYLLHGVWAEEPETNNYFYPKFERKFKSEIINVIDVIHGNAVIDPEPGHAHGSYSSDISKYIIGIILGREWEPRAVIRTNRVNSTKQFNGNFISINNGNAMEVWLAQMMDFTVQYETQTYTAQHPLSFVNWLPLDPMHHNTEFIENKTVREFDNDLEEIDFRKYNSTPLFPPGIFASYHVYPYYPDFIYLQKNYADAKNRKGEKDNYYGYLDELKRFTPSMPLVIAEYGLPSSRGNSHSTPLGFNQGGHNEQEQAALSWQLTKDIYDTKCAGAVFFEWIDEWFKFNWLVMDFEQPYERRKLWHNMENPEQNFGIVAVTSQGKIIDGDLKDWEKKPKGTDGVFIDFYADASYFYIAAQLPEFNLENQKLYLAIDTYDKEKGDHHLPFLNDRLKNGIEFLISIDSINNSKIKVDDSYSVYTDIYHNLVPVYTSSKNENGRYVDQILLSNRGRRTLTNDSIPPVLFNRSKLLFGKSSNPNTSNANWYWNPITKILEVRLDWHLLNVCDPSERRVLDDRDGTPAIEYTQTKGFHIFPYITDKKDQITSYPLNSEDYFLTCDTWEQPAYEMTLKPLYHTFRDSFPMLTPHFTEDSLRADNFSITPFFNNKQGAISIAFDGYDTPADDILPLLTKYKIKATFAMQEDMSNFSYSLKEDNKHEIKGVEWSQLEELANKEHEIALKITAEKDSKTSINSNILLFNLKRTKEIIEQTISKPVSTIFYPIKSNFDESINSIKNAGYQFVCTEAKNTTVTYNQYNLQPINAWLYTPSELDSIIHNGKGKWQQFKFTNFSKKDFQEIHKDLSESTNLINPDLLDQEIRLLRNADYWVAPISAVGKYMIEKNASEIKFIIHNNIIFLTVRNNLSHDFNQPLTIAYSTSHKKVKISDSFADGIYDVREGVIYLHAFPNKEVQIEILD